MGSRSLRGVQAHRLFGDVKELKNTIEYTKGDYEEIS